MKSLSASQLRLIIIDSYMNFGEEKCELTPILFYLENDRVGQLIRVMFNRKVSQDYLLRYGSSPQSTFSRTQLNKIQSFARTFDRMEILHLKGSHKHSIKYHTNTFLQMCLRKKLQASKLFKPSERKEAWLQLTEFYQSPLLFEQLDQFQLPGSLEQTIAKDVNRTQISPDLLGQGTAEEHKKKNADMRNHLTRILEQLAKYNPYIGYCQGLNNIVLFLIEEGFDDQEAFFVMKKITEELIPCDYYSTMNSVLALVRLLCDTLGQTHPKAVKAMKLVAKNNGGEGISIITGFAIQWFVCLFTNTNLHRDMRRCILDHFMLDGMPVLLKAALCYFDAIEPKIARAQQLEQFNPIVEKTIREYDDVGHLSQQLTHIYINKTIFGLVLQKLTAATEKRKKYFVKSKCDHRWTTCLQTVENYFQEGYTHDFFVFKPSHEIKIINNYLEKHNRNCYFNIKNTSKVEQAKIGRMEHTCRPTSTTSRTVDNDNYQQQNGQQMLATMSSNTKTQFSPQSKNSEHNKHYDIFEPEKKEMVRSKALQQLEVQHEGKKEVLNHSESVQFMRQMIQNESFSNLMDILEVEEMEDLFKDCISENQDDNQL